MATKTITQTLDDINGDEGATNHTIGLDGRLYSIDLTDDNWNALTNGTFLGEVIEKARPTGILKAATAKPTRNRTPQNTNRIRAWAWAQGYQLGNRGRIPASIVAAYHAAPENHDA